MKSTMPALIGGALHQDLLILDFYDHVRRERAGEFALRPLHSHPVFFADIDSHAWRDMDRHTTDTRHKDSSRYQM